MLTGCPSFWVFLWCPWWQGQAKAKKSCWSRSQRGLTNLPRPCFISYGQDIDKALDQMEKIIEENRFLTDIYPARWWALNILKTTLRSLILAPPRDKETANKLIDIGEKLNRHMSATLDTHPEGMIADQRYGFINSVLNRMWSGLPTTATGFSAPTRSIRC